MFSRKYIAVLCLLMGTASLTAEAKDFSDGVYKDMDSLVNIRKLVYHECANPRWLGDDTLVYETRDAGGMHYFNAIPSAGKKTEVSKATCDSLVKAAHLPAPRDPYEDFPPSRVQEIKSPDGLGAALIKDNNVWIKKYGPGGDSTLVQVSFDGTSNDCYVDLHWSPDSRRVAAIRRQDAAPHRIPLVESSPADQVQPKLQWRDYYKPGDVIPISRPALFDAVNLKQIPVDAKPFEGQYDLYFRRWRRDSKAFTFDFNARGHQKYQIVDVDAETGATKAIIDEESDTFIDWERVDARFLEKSDEVILSSERGGWRQLYLIDAATGAVKKQLTQGEWVVRGIEDIDEEKHELIIWGNGLNASKGEDPYDIHYYRLNLKSGKLTDLTPENANHIVSFTKDHKHFLDLYSRPDVEQTSVIRSSKDGSVVLPLEKEDISALYATGWRKPETFSFKGRDGQTDIWGNVYYPFDYDPSKKYPVVEYIYAGPQDSFVPKDFYSYIRFSKLLKLGFFVVSIDGMGTNNRSKAFHDVCWHNLKDAGFPDRIIWIKDAVGKIPAMDISKGVGIFGYSAGGQNALGGLLFHPEFYTVGVALCGCHDNRMDKLWWNEQWMGYPIGPWYAESSNVDNAWRLQGRLLIINGELDDNVDPTSTLQVVNALVKANKDFEQFYMPMHSHNLGDDWVSRQIYHFFYKNMK